MKSPATALMNRRVKKVLIVDDDKKIAAALAVRLAAAGYETLVAYAGVEGLKLALGNRPDLVIMDLWMPDGVGFVIAERLKHFGLADVPVIFITASKKANLWELAQEAGAAGFFEKPYDPEKLLRAIARALHPDRCSPPAELLNVTPSNEPIIT